MIYLKDKLTTLSTENLKLWYEGNLYFNESSLYSESKNINNIFLTTLEVKDVLDKSGINESDNPFYVTYMCEEDYDELYELQESLIPYGFLNNRTYFKKYDK